MPVEKLGRLVRARLYERSLYMELVLRHIGRRPRNFFVESESTKCFLEM